MIQTEEQLDSLFGSDYGTRVVLLIHRSKEGGKNNKFKRHLRKIITRGRDEFYNAVNELESIRKTDDRPLRIYATYNSRNLNKAIRTFKESQLSADYDSNDNKETFYIDVKNRFISALMKDSSKDQHNFIFDFDGCDEKSFIQISNKLKKHTEILLDYKTKNGYHCITKPFNYNVLESDERFKDTLKTDGLMLISY